MKLKFNYLATPTLLTNLQQGLSTNRVGRYLTLGGGSLERALQLYAWNTAVSESLYGPLQALEVLTRNRIHDALSSTLGSAEWYDQAGLLKDPQRKKLDDAKNKLRDQNKVISPPSVVAELAFGFWTGLLSRAYDSTLWRWGLFRLYQSRLLRNKRTDVHADYEIMRKLRNRIAHHECVLSADLPNQHKLILSLTRTMCPDTAAWVEHHSRFGDMWNDPANPWLPVPAIPAAPAAASPAAKAVSTAETPATRPSK